MFTTILHGLWSRKRRLLGTSVAVVLGVAFLAATLILGDTTKASFGEAFASANDGTDVIVRDSTRIGSEEDRVRRLIDESMVETVAAVDGVAAAHPEVRGRAQLLDADGDRIGGNGPPTIATNWIDDLELSALTLVEGRQPAPVDAGQPIEVVIDQASAVDGDLTVGDTTSVLTPSPTPVSIVGLATFGDTGSLGGTTYVAFDTETAQRILTGGTDEISGVLVRADDSISAAELERRIAGELPNGLEAITGAELTAEMEADVERDFLGFFRTIMLAFAGIAIVVAAFSIHNTFSILVAQRTRESALMRAIGASRRQVIVGVAAEALLVGIVSTVIGFAAGIGIGSLLQNLMESGLDMPNADLVISTSAVVAAAIVGIGTTLVASVGPAIKASRVAPLAALRDVAIDRSGASKTRAVLGTLLAGAGVAAVVTATSSDAAVTQAGLGSLALLIGAVALGPVVARPAAAILGTGPAVTRGIAGRLARRNAMRNPRRTAASASALLVGTAVVGLFTTFGASVKASINDAVDDRFTGDFVIVPDGFSGSQLSPELAPAIAELPAVNRSVGTTYGPAIIDGDSTELAATDGVDQLDAVFELGLIAGSFDGFATGDLAVSEHYADEHDVVVGATIPISWVDGATTDFTVAAVYEDRMTFGDLLITSEDLAAHIAQPQVTVVLIDVVDGADLDAAKAEIVAVSGEFGSPDPMDQAEYRKNVAAEIDAMLYFVYGLLGVAVFIALMGIANTLSLSIHDRTRELGLLRAVGQDRAQVRSTVRWESVIIAVFGTVGGIGLGSFLGWGLMRAMNAEEGFGKFALPVVPLTVVLVLAAAAGVVAAWRPSRRAARTDILAAIATA